VLYLWPDQRHLTLDNMPISEQEFLRRGQEQSVSRPSVTSPSTTTKPGMSEADFLARGRQINVPQNHFNEAGVAEFKPGAIQSFLQKWNPNQIMTGQLKGLASTVIGASELGEKGLKAFGRLITPKRFEEQMGYSSETPTGAEQLKLKERFATAETPLEKVGFFTEQIAELATPVGAEKIALKVPAFLEKAPVVVQTLSKFVPKAIATASDFGWKTALQTGGDKKEVEKAMLFGLLAAPIEAAARPVVQKAFPAVAKWLEKINLRLTPVQKRDLATRIDDVTTFMQERKIVGTPEMRYNKVDEIYEAMEPKLEKFLTSVPEERFAKRDELVSQLENLKSKFQNERDVLAIERQVDEMINTLQTKYDLSIPLKRLNELKRSTYRNAYNRAGSKVMDAVEHDIGDVFRGTIEKNTEGMLLEGKPIGGFNREYGTVINAKSC